MYAYLGNLLLYSLLVSSTIGPHADALSIDHSVLPFIRGRGSGLLAHDLAERQEAEHPCGQSSECSLICSNDQAPACENGRCVCGPIGDGEKPVDEKPVDPKDKYPQTNVCSGKSAFTSQTWQAMEMDRWLHDQIGVLAEERPPEDLGPGNGMPTIWASYNEHMEHDDLFFWPSVCKQVSSTCTFGDSDFISKCPEAPQRAMMLWGMYNFARFLQQLLDSLDKTSLISGLQIPQLSSTFGEQISPDTAMSPASVMTVMAGIFTALGSLIPAPFGAGLNLGAGIFTIVSGVLSKDSGHEDPRFTTFAALSSEFGNALQTARARIEEYYGEMFGSGPGRSPEDSLETLGGLFRGGVFANSDITLSQNVANEGNQIVAIQSGIINMLWREQQVYIARIPKGRLAEVEGLSPFAYDPCFGVDAKRQNGFLRSVLYCDEQASYLIIGWQGHMWSSYSQTDEALAAYGWDKGKIVRSSLAAQQLTNSFGPPSSEVLGRYMEQLAADAEADPGKRPGSMQALFQFSLPVCDLGAAEVKFDAVMCPEPGPPDSLQGENKFALCLMALLTKTCSQYSVGGEAWPYGVV